jgi:c-di-GMP-binding flagellar brake protein YcgR
MIALLFNSIRIPMDKIKDKLIERRRYIRLEVPLKVTYTIPELHKIYTAVAKNISADGIRFETHERAIKESSVIELKLDIPNVASAVHIKGRVIWKSKLSLEDSAPFDVGVEFLEIEDDNKNTFLKFLCDLIYSLPEDAK